VTIPAQQPAAPPVVITACPRACPALQGGAEGRRLRRRFNQAWPQPPSWARRGSRGLRAGDAERRGECAGAAGPALPGGGRADSGCGRGSGLGCCEPRAGMSGVRQVWGGVAAVPEQRGGRHLGAALRPFVPIGRCSPAAHLERTVFAEAGGRARAWPLRHGLGCWARGCPRLAL
jgi:hypothetical protein